jgi:hypothetical protein
MVAVDSIGAIDGSDGRKRVKEFVGITAIRNIITSEQKHIGLLATQLTYKLCKARAVEEARIMYIGNERYPVSVERIGERTAPDGIAFHTPHPVGRERRTR